MENFKNRIEEFAKSERLSIRKFESMCGLYSGYFNKLTKPPRLEHLNAIKEAFPNINIDWLLHGDGSMYNNVTLENCTNTAANNSNVTIGIDANVMKIIEEKDTQISRLLTIIENLSK